MNVSSVIFLVLALVTLQRLGELVIARRNTRRLLVHGAYEIGRGHYPLIVLLHAGWLLALWLLWLRGEASLQIWFLVAYIVLQSLRVWVMLSLGRFWTTRIIVVPQAPLVRRGPYRWVRHPNYLIVIMEIALLPLALGATGLAVIFTLANLLVLGLRLRVEAASLRQRPMSASS